MVQNVGIVEHGADCRCYWHMVQKIGTSGMVQNIVVNATWYIILAIVTQGT